MGEYLAELSRRIRLSNFKLSAWAAVKYLSGSQRFFTTDDVWAFLEEFNANCSPDPRALGSVMRAAKSDGLIAATNFYQPSTRTRVNHGRLILQWKSLVYGEENLEKG